MAGCPYNRMRGWPGFAFWIQHFPVQHRSKGNWRSNRTASAEREERREDKDMAVKESIWEKEPALVLELDLLLLLLLIVPDTVIRRKTHLPQRLSHTPQKCHFSANWAYGVGGREEKWVIRAGSPPWKFREKQHVQPLVRPTNTFLALKSETQLDGNFTYSKGNMMDWNLSFISSKTLLKAPRE